MYMALPREGPSLEDVMMTQGFSRWAILCSRPHPGPPVLTAILCTQARQENLLQLVASLQPNGGMQLLCCCAVAMLMLPTAACM